MINRIAKGGVLSTDGWPAYPAIAQEIGCTHKVVNHSVEFKTGPDSEHPGTHTNHVEVIILNLLYKYFMAKFF